LRIIVSNRSGVPIYEQIKAQIKDAIFSGELEEDDLLPSIRQLARDLKISVITTTRAYNDLQEEGFVVNVQGKGCYVLPKNKEMARENALRRVEHTTICRKKDLSSMCRERAAMCCQKTRKWHGRMRCEGLKTGLG